MTRSQRHLIERQGYASNGESTSEGVGGGVTEILNIAGQSNAVAADANTFQSQDEIVDSRVLMWSETGGGPSGDVTKQRLLLPYSHPVLFEYTNPPGVGPYVRYIQNWLLTAGPLDKLVVLCSARGGTAVVADGGGGFGGGRWRYPDGDLYLRMLAGATNVVAAVRAAYPANRVKFTTIWQQGESDVSAITPVSAAQYKTGCTPVFNNLRTTLAAAGVTDDIILAGGMTTLFMQGGGPPYDLFEEGQVELFTSVLPRSFFVGRVQDNGGGPSGTAGDIIHYDVPDQRVNGDNYWAARPRAVTLSTNRPATPGNVTLNAQTISFNAVNCAQYAIEVSPVGAGTWTRTLVHASYPNSTSDVLSFTLPGSGDRDARVFAVSNAGDSVASPIVTYTAPVIPEPARYHDLDFDNVTVDGSNNIISIPNLGSQGAWQPKASGPVTGAAAAITRVLQQAGSPNRYKAHISSANKRFSLVAGAGLVVPAGDYSILMAFFYDALAGTGALLSTDTNSTALDIHLTMANSGANIRLSHTSTGVQLLTTGNGFNAMVDKWVAVGVQYTRSTNTARLSLNAATLPTTGTLTQRAASPSNAGFIPLINGLGIDSSSNGLPLADFVGAKIWSSAISDAELQVAINNIAAAKGITFG